MLSKWLTSVITDKTWNWHFTNWIKYVLPTSLPSVNRLVFCVYVLQFYLEMWFVCSVQLLTFPELSTTCCVVLWSVVWKSITCSDRCDYCLPADCFYLTSYLPSSMLAKYTTHYSNSSLKQVFICTYIKKDSYILVRRRGKRLVNINELERKKTNADAVRHKDLKNNCLSDLEK